MPRVKTIERIDIFEGEVEPDMFDLFDSDLDDWANFEPYKTLQEAEKEATRIMASRRA